MDKYCPGQFDKFGIHVNNYEMFRSSLETCHFNYYMKCITYFTSDNLDAHKFYLNHGGVFKKIGKNRLCLKFPDKKRVEFSKLSDLIGHGDKEEKLIKDFSLLNYNDRMGHCHNRSLVFILLCDIDGGSLVSGYVNSTCRNERIVHTWIETGKGNVIDISHNLSISKQDYYEFMNPKVINRISRDVCLEDAVILGKVFKHIPFSLKTYCLFRDEMMNDLKRNYNLDIDSYQKKLK